MIRGALCGLMLILVLLVGGCVPGATSQPGAALPDTSAPRALVRQYLDFVAAERYADAWQLLTPDRQRRQPLASFEANWRARGRLEPARSLWPADLDEVRADVWRHRPDGSGGLERWRFWVAHVGSSLRVAEERPLSPTEPISLPRSPEDAVRTYVVANYGLLWLRTVTMMHQEPFADGQVVIFRVLNPLLDQRPDPTPTAILLFLQPHGSGWQIAGGGGIATIAEMDRDAVACAWTWLRFTTDQPTEAAFSCTIEDPRIAVIELDSVEGHRWVADVRGRRAVVFPYAWDMQSKWPAQQPRAIRLFDAAGRGLNLPSSPVAGERS